MQLPKRNGKFVVEFSKQDRTYLQKAMEIARQAAKHSLEDEVVQAKADEAATGLERLLDATAPKEA